MYKLIIQLESGKSFKKELSEVGLRAIINSKTIEGVSLKGGVKWATVMTPSGAKKDLTKFL